MTLFLKCTGAANDQSTVVFLHLAQEQRLGDGGRYFSKFGFKDLRQNPTKYSISSHTKRQFIEGEASRLLKNKRPKARCLGQLKGGQARGAIGINQPVNETSEQSLACMRYKEGLFITLKRLFWAGVPSQVSAKHSILEKSKARQGSRRAKETPRMASTMN